MKRNILFSVIITLLIAVAGISMFQPAEVDARVFYWGAPKSPTFYTVSDTTSYTTTEGYQTIVEVVGQSGVIHMVIFNNDATHDPYLRLTIDGLQDSVNIADNEEKTAYLIPFGGIKNATGVDRWLDVSDSTNTIRRLDMPFSNQLLLEHASEAAGLTSTTVIYSVWE